MKNPALSSSNLSEMNTGADNSSSQVKNPRVLLIDDDSALAAMLFDFLLGEGFDLQHAPTGSSGLEMATKPDIAVVLLDVTLPDMNGFEVLGELKSRSHVPVIMLTLHGSVADRVKGLNSGADDYLPKPFVAIELVARIQSVLRRNGQPPRDQERLVVDDLAVTASARAVLQDDTAVSCTAAEFDALHCLLQCAGSVVSKEDLTRAALGRTSYSGDRGVDNLIHALRRKLGPRLDGEDRFKAIRNFGYVYLRSTPVADPDGTK